MIAELAKHYPEIRVCDFGHVGDGGIHFNLIDQIDASEWTNQREISVRDLVIQTAVEEFHGCFSAEHGVGPFNQRYFDRYAPEKTSRIFNGIRERDVPVDPSVASISAKSEHRFRAILHPS